MIVKKKMVSVIVILFLIITSSVEVLAVPLEFNKRADIQPYWENTSNIVIDFSIEGGEANIIVSIDGYKGVDKITAIATLEQLNSDGTYSKVEKWDNISTSARRLDWSSSRYVTKGKTYRFTITATVYKNGVGEMVNVYKNAIS